MDAAVMTVPEFRTFYDGWSRTEMEYLDEIRDKLKAVAEAGRRPPQRELKVAVDKIMNHISIYHDMKVQAATSETSAVAAGVWNTPLEAGFIWLGGWRPAAAIMLAYSLMGMQIENELQALLNGVDGSTFAPSAVSQGYCKVHQGCVRKFLPIDDSRGKRVHRCLATLLARGWNLLVPWWTCRQRLQPTMLSDGPLCFVQLRSLDDLQQNIKDSEEGPSDRLALLQMMLASEEITKAACTDNFHAEGVDMEELDKVVDKKLDCLRDLLIDADKLRLDTLHRMISILTPMQSSQFLVAAMELLMAIRELGMIKFERSGEDGQEEESNDAEELHCVAAKGQTAILKKLVTSGADVSKPDFDGRTPLHLAASKGHTASVSVLINEGADVNATDERGTTPILYALKGGHDKAAKALLEAGAKVAESEVGVELCRAAACGDLQYLRTLVHSAKCDPNTADYDQRTPLHLAAAGGIYPAVDILLRAGGNALAEDRHGFTPLEEARSANHWLVVELLNNYVPPESRVDVEGRTGAEEDEDMTAGEDSAPMLADG